MDSAVALGGRVPVEQVKENVERFLDAESVTITISTKKTPEKQVDLKSWVQELRVVTTLKDLDEQAGPYLFMRADPNARPLTILEHLLRMPVPGSWLYRVDLLARGPLGMTPIR